jgi:hypothetical protein
MGAGEESDKQSFDPIMLQLPLDMNSVMYCGFNGINILYYMMDMDLLDVR